MNQSLSEAATNCFVLVGLGWVGLGLGLGRNFVSCIDQVALSAKPQSRPVED